MFVGLLFVNQDLKELMEQFYVLTGLRLVLFDENYNELLAYPPEKTHFCRSIRQNPQIDSLCRKSDCIAFENCRKTRSLNIYKCHAGLIEVTTPLTSDGMVIGYIMFGQITDIKDKNELSQMLLKTLEKNHTDINLTETIRQIRYKSMKQIIAASKILDACANYILYKEIVKPSKVRLLEEIEQFVEEHIAEEIHVTRLCDEFHISRTRLYELLEKNFSGGIAAYIRHKKMQRAKDLLSEHKLSTAEVADAVGFSDYNYFLRVFKRTYGISPKKMFRDT